jgi:hypothetical protein
MNQKWKLFVILAIVGVSFPSLLASQETEGNEGTQPADTDSVQSLAGAEEQVVGSPEESDDVNATGGENIREEPVVVEPAPAPQPTTETRPSNPPVPTPRRTPEPLRDSPRMLMFLLGPGFNLGIFRPKDVGRYIDEVVNADSAQVQEGFTDMVINIVPRITFKFLPIEYVEIEAVAEIGWGPKAVVVVGGSSESFHFVRFSAGGTVSGHIPLRNYRNSLFFGGGVLYHSMRFEDYEAGTPGYRGQMGFRFYGRRFTPEIFASFDYIKGYSGKAFTYDNERTKEMVLNYTGGMIGANFLFNIIHR